MKKILEKLKIKERTFKYISFILIIAIFIQASCIDILALDISEKIENISNIILDKTKEVNQIETIEPAIEESKVEEVIKIYNFRQLENVGTGNVVKNNAGVEQVYSKDSKYMLMRDIKIPKGEKWNLPDDFEGEFVENNNRKSSDNEEKDVYDEKKNAVKIYNNYQLNEIGKEDSPVMSNDGTPEEFGMGKPVYGEDSSENMTYDESNDYIISEDFTEEMPDLIANSIATSSYPLPGENPDGRTYPGQVTYNHNGKDYILIGNESQLRAIGSNKFVTPRLYLYAETKAILGLIKIKRYIPYYPGDADLDLTAFAEKSVDNEKVDGSKGYIFYEKHKKYELADVKWDDENGVLGAILDLVGDLVGGLLGIVGSLLAKVDFELCGVNAEGLPDRSIGEKELQREYKKYRYSSDADYIIFRDIDLSASGKNSNGEDDNWNPISVSGDVKGWKSLIPDKEEAITISNVNVLQQGLLDTSNGAGIGFFGSISNRISDEEKTFGHSKGTTVVENLRIENISVENQSEKVKVVDLSLVKILLETVAGLLGGVVGTLEFILGLILPNTNINLADMLVELLTLHSKRPDVFATGSFAGRVVGDVNIKNCETVNATVKNVKDISGGFVGYTEGTEKYDGLSEILGGTVKVLSKLLNILPGVGLGDLIKLLLEKDIKLGHLIPVGYYKPTIENCNITLNNIGSEKTSYNGGFVGIQIGTNISNSNVNGLQSVIGANFVGGFAGISRDAILKGLLKDLGIDINAIDVKSKQIGCSVTGNGIAINAIKINKNPVMEYSSNNSEEKKLPDGDYAGGFNGAMSNSRSENCSITGLSSVKTEGSYAGGFTGRATTGFGATLGADTVGKSTLLKSVSSLLSTVLGNKDKLGSVLSLVGIEPTILINSNVNGSNIEISAAENYAGGYIGQGDGVKINPKPKEESGTTPQPENPEQAQTAQVQGKTTIENISSVTAKNYSGGVAGSVSTADAIGLLNNALGVGSYIKFEIHNIELNKNTTAVDPSVPSNPVEPNIPSTDNNQEQTKEVVNETTNNPTEEITNSPTTVTGMKIVSEDTYAAGGIGLAVGGDISNVNINDISSVNAKNYAAGFIGRAGAGGLTDVQGLDLLGLGLVKINNVLSLAQGIRLNIETSNVNGNSSGYTVEATGYQGDIAHNESILAGGFIAEAAAIKVKDSHVKNLKYVTLPTAEGKDSSYTVETFGGGFVGRVHTGGLLGLAKEENGGGLKLPGIIDVSSVLGLVPYLIPRIERSTVTFYKEEKPKEEANKPKEQVTNGESSDTSNKEVVTKLSNGEKVNTDKVENTLNDNKQNINKDESNKVDNGKTEENKLETNKIEEEKNPSRKENNTENVDMWKNIKENELLEQMQPQVIADYAGGFAGEIESAQIDNSKVETQPEPQPQPEQKPEPEPQPTEQQKNVDSNLEQNKNYKKEENKEIVNTEQTTEESKVYETKSTEPERQFAVFNLEKVSGYKYAGGFAGNVIAGGAASSDGLKLLNGILNLNISNLLSVLDVYIPRINSSGVKSVEAGLVVESNSKDGYAGGYVGRASGAQIKDSDVTLLKHTAVTPPTHEYESKVADSYFSRTLSGYAVRAGRYAGGYVGRADIDSAASAGGGISLLGDTLGIENVLNALDVVSTNIENSNVYGAPGGYSVIADGLKENKKEDIVGHSGGYAGFVSGSNLNNCNSYNFEYIIGRETAGGHTGRAEPGNTAAVIESASIIDKVANISENVASVLNTFIPQVIDSETTAVPCGGIVRAEGLTDTMYKRGYAGGYIGHNEGARIKGEKKEAATIRIRSVYGGESSGGFSGVTESANVADTGNIKILAGLVKVTNLLNVLNAVYPTETNTAVYGPLRKLDIETWNKWVKYVGSNGVFGTTLPTEEVKTEAELNKLIKEYAYGYNVKAGRNTEATSPGEYGTAGGYVGYMKSGVITDAHAWDAKEVNAYRASGGFVGEMITGGVAEIGGLKLLDQTILGNTLSAVQTFVPVIKNSGVTGYQSGLKVFCDINTSKNTSIKNVISNFANTEKVAKKGYSGGFAGHIIGGQIWGNEGVKNKAIEDITPIKTEDTKTEESKTDAPNKENSKVNEDVIKENVSVEPDKKKEERASTEALNKKEVQNNEAQKEENTSVDDKKEPQEAQKEDSTNKENIKEVSNKEEKGYDAVKDPNYKKCYVHNLRRVEGTQDVGGFAGKIENGSATSLDTATDGGLLGGLLNGLVKAPKDLIRLMNATVSTVRAVDVRAWDDWGIVINGAYLESQARPLSKEAGVIKYAEDAGGFAGEINGAVIGDKDKPENGVNIENIRTVTAGEHAGGFFGKADVSAIAEVSGDKGTSILQNLVNLGSVDALDTFRTYIYNSKVVGAERAGIEVYSKEGKELGYVNRPIYTGNAGGFGGTLLDGSVKNSSVEKLRNVRGINYTGGFVGHSGKSGAVNLENANVLDKFLGATAGVLDVFGSHIEDSSVVGILKNENDSEGQKGYSVKSENRTLGTDKSEIAGGFVGFAELAKIDRCSSTNLMQVASGETAGGFAGETSFAYLASVAADSPIVKALLQVIGIVVKAIYNNTLAELIKGGIKVDLGLVKVSLVSGTDVVEVNLLGIIVRISVNKQADKEFDVVIVEIGDSKIALSCDKLGNVQTDKNKLDELSINLIKANRTRISDSTVTGIAKGYDVFGSGSGNTEAAITDKGYVGGFVGFNNEGLLRKNKMVYADAIKGPAESEVETVSPDGATGIFTGSSSLKSNYHFNNLKNIEAEGNLYSIYRKLDAIYSEIEDKAGGTIHLGSRVDGSWNNVYDIKHFDEVKKLDELKDAKAVDDKKPNVENALMVYRDQGSKAVLMGDEPTYPLAPDQEMEPGDMQDPCSETVVINLEKIWKDWKPEQRPDQITFWIWGTYKDEKGQEVWDENAKHQVTLTKEQMQDENTWKLYIKNLPAYFVDPGTKKKIYYTYKIKEEEIPDYKVSIDYEVKVENDKNDIYHIIVTNSKKWQYILPETGGLGYAMLYIIGIGLIVIAIETYRRKYKSKQA